MLRPFGMEGKLSEYRKYPKTEARTIIDYNNVISNIGEKGLFCFNVGLLPIIRDLLGSRGLWRTSYSIDSDDGGYYIPDVEEFVPIDRAIKQFLAEVEDMSCDITEGLERISQAIRLSSGSGCCAEGTGGVSPETPEVEFSDDGENYPSGFANRTEYVQHKCAASQLFINELQASANWSKTATFTLAAGSTIAVGILIPGVNIGLLIGLVVAAVLATAQTVIFQNIVDWLDADNDDILCAVYSSISVNAAYSSLVALVDTSSLTALEGAITKTLFTTAALNRLFDNTANVSGVAADCQDCDPIDCPEYTVGYGTELDTNLADIQTVLRDGDTADWVVVAFTGADPWSPPGTPCGIGAEISSITKLAGGTISSYRFYNVATGAVIYNGATPTYPVHNVGSMRVYTAFGAGRVRLNIDWTLEE